MDIKNEEKFTGKADIYSKFRPAYPSELIDYIYAEAGIDSDSAVADIGSGTGIFTELLLARANRVFAVEPNADMRREADKNLSRYSNYISIDAPAENTTLKDNSISLITAAQAFHWFDRPRFKKECSRILTTGGKVALVWNCRDENSELVTQNDEIIRRYCPRFKGAAGGTRGIGPDEYADIFAGGTCEYKTFQNDLFYDEQGFIGRNLSSSYAPKEGEEQYTEYVSALRDLFLRHAVDGRLTMPNITRSYMGRV